MARVVGGFFELADGSRLTQERQKALLRTCLTTEMRATLAHAIPVADTATVDELLNAIGAHFRRQRNIALSCVQFEERKQQHGETFDRFFVGLKELAANADLCATCLKRQNHYAHYVGRSLGSSAEEASCHRPIPSPEGRPRSLSCGGVSGTHGCRSDVEAIRQCSLPLAPTGAQPKQMLLAAVGSRACVAGARQM